MTIPTPTPQARRRPRDLDATHWLLLAETATVIAAASIVIKLLPFRRVVRLASPFPSPRMAGRFCVDDLAWAVEAAARRLPWRTVCFQKGLALHWMLRRRGIASVLHYGVGKDDAGALAAHVWISAGERIVQGADVVDRFHRLASYPSEASESVR